MTYDDVTIDQQQFIMNYRNFLFMMTIDIRSDSSFDDKSFI